MVTKETHDFQEYNGIIFHRKKGNKYFNKCPYGFMHVYMWETENGKKKPDGYVVHHIDEDKSHNHISNLVLWTKKYHDSWHSSHRSIETLKKTGKPVICVETGIEYYSAAEASKQTGIGNIRAVTTGKRKYAGGYSWNFSHER